MVTHKQSKQFTALHKKLGNVYHKKEATRVGLLALYESMKTFYSGVDQEYENKKALGIKNSITDSHNDDFMLPYLEKLTSFCGELEAFMLQNIPINDELSALMRHVVQQHKILSDDGIAVAKADTILAEIAAAITPMEKQINESAMAFEALKQHFALLRTAYHYDKN